MSPNLECPQCYTCALNLFSLDPQVIEDLNEPKITLPPKNDMFEYLHCDLCNHVIAVNSLVDHQGELLDLEPLQIDYDALEINGAELLNKRRAHNEFNWLYEHLQNICPKSSSGYITMKKSNSKNFISLKEKAAENGVELLPWIDRWRYEPIEKWTEFQVK
jgi:hypothetical protein